MFGRIISRIRSLSFFEVFIAISIIAFTVFVVKYFGQKVDYKTIRIEVINKSWSENYNPYGYRTPFWLSDKLKVGQKEYDKSGKVLAEVIDVENYLRGGEEAEVYLTVKVKTTYQKRLHQHFFKDKPLDLGSAIEIAPDQNIVFGQIIDLDAPEKSTGYPQKTMTLTVRGRGIEKSIIDQIKKGETMINRYNQQAVGTILDFDTENTTRVFATEVTTTNNAIGFRVSPNTKDVILKIQITANQIDNRWYFAGHQNIKIGNALYFYGQDINLYNLEIENIQ
ncbi:MAG: DUF4330 family protein [Candidatus Shapirobacteria bacterium]|jgi:hypothetical protein